MLMPIIKGFLNKSISIWEVRNEKIDMEMGSGTSLTSHFNNPVSHFQLRTSFHRARPAFSLVEILLALFIVAALLTIILTSAGTLKTGYRSNLQSLATKIASRDIENLRKMSFASLPADTGSTCLSDYASDLSKLPNPCHTRSVTNFQNDVDIKQITTTITWYETGAQQCVLSTCIIKMSTLIYKNGL